MAIKNQESSNKMKKVSLVLSGGGARGIAHIGVLEELRSQQYEIHAITGTSMGAVVGGIYAAGKIDEFKKWISDLDKIDVFKLVDFSLFDTGFVKGDKVFEKLSTFIQDIQIEDLKIRFSATATDLISKKEIIFTEGSLYDALRASIAIPNIITPVKKEGSLLVDGGVVDNIPIRNAFRIDDDILIAVNANADIRLDQKKEKQHSYYKKIINSFNNSLRALVPARKANDLSYFDILTVSYELMRNEMVKSSLENNPPDVLIEISRDICEIYDFYKAQELIELGHKATIRAIDNYKNKS